MRKIVIALASITMFFSSCDDEKEPLPTYVVKFFGFGGKSLDAQTIEHGKSAEAPAVDEVITTDSCVYTFKGWDKEFNSVTSDLDVNALYTNKANSYAVKFFGFGGAVLSDTTVTHGTSAIAPSVSDSIVTDSCVYTFKGWDKEFSNVKSDLDVNALYTNKANSYVVKFFGFGGASLDAQVIEYGKSAAEPEVKTVVETDSCDWTFTGWDADFDAIKADTTINAVYERGAEKSSVVTVTFDGIKKDDVEVSFKWNEVITDDAVIAKLGNLEVEGYTWKFENNKVVYTPIADTKVVVEFVGLSKDDVEVSFKWNEEINDKAVIAKVVAKVGSLDVEGYTWKFENNKVVYTAIPDTKVVVEFVGVERESVEVSFKWNEEITDDAVKAKVIAKVGSLDVDKYTWKYENNKVVYTKVPLTFTYENGVITPNYDDVTYMYKSYPLNKWISLGVADEDGNISKDGLQAWLNGKGAEYIFRIKGAIEETFSSNRIVLVYGLDENNTITSDIVKFVIE